MADPANFAAIQQRITQATRQATRVHVLRQLLAEFEPGQNDTERDYQALLLRAQTVLAAALKEESAAPA